MSSKTYQATIVPAVGGLAITVSVSANNPQQATQLIQNLYGPVKNWYRYPNQVQERKSGK